MLSPGLFDLSVAEGVSNTSSHIIVGIETLGNRKVCKNIFELSLAHVFPKQNSSQIFPNLGFGRHLI